MTCSLQSLKLRLTSTARLESMALAGRHNRRWYTQAHQSIVRTAQQLNVSPNYLADIIAITSPRTSVRRNQRVALTYILSRSFPNDVIKSVHQAMAHYESTGIIRGRKTYPFSLNLRGLLGPITLDVWMAQAFQIDQRRFNLKNVHAECCRQIRTVAHHLGWRPAEAQAAIWTTTVTEHGRNVPAFDITEELTLFD